jgi:HAD superfamily hydrolase (TIGR01509 family)
MSQFKLVIFDCDGVLVDSERITNQVLVDMLGELGFALSLDEAIENFVGRSLGQCLDTIAVLLGTAPPDHFAATFHSRTTAALEANILAVPGVRDALDAIAVPCCVASSGDHEKMRITLGATGLLSRFAGRIFSVTEVTHPKPAPDIFLHAASRCGVSPAQCVVVEDTPTGVAAGVAAGMTVLGYCALTPDHRLSAAGAHQVFDYMGDLPGLLEHLGRSPNNSSKPTPLRGAA